jgi:dihydroflavonol-4-reductase
MESEVLRAAAGGLEVVVAIPTMTFGPGDVKAFTGRLLILAAKGLLVFSLPGVLNFADVREVAAGHLAAGERLESGERVILGGHNIPVPEALGIICSAAGRGPPLLTVPRDLVEIIGRVLFFLPVFMLEDHMTTLHCWQPLSTERMKQVLGIQPRPFSSTVRDALDWYQRRGYC